MREMKDSGISWIGDLPSAWATMPIKYNFTLVAGATPDSHNPDLWDGDVNWITPADFKTEDVYVKEGSRKLSEIGFKSCSTSMIPAGSIIFSKRAPIGTVAINTTELCTNQGCLGLVKKSRGLDNKYYYYVLSIYPEVFNLFGSGTTFKEISATAFGEVSLPFPPINEQHRISTYLDSKCSEIDALTENIQSQIDTLEQYKHSVITEAVTKGLDRNVEMKESGLQWVGKMPAKWKIGRIGSLYTLRTEKVSDEDFPPLSVTMNGIVPQLDTAAKTEDHNNRKLVRKGDFVINSRSDRRGSCGISAYDGSVSLINTVLKPNEEMNPNYYNWFFHTPIFADEFYKWGHGIVDDLWTTGWNDMKKIYIPQPHLDEQQQIALFLNDKCTEVNTIISEKQKQLTILDSYKKSMIYEYVTGKKEVPISD